MRRYATAALIAGTCSALALLVTKGFFTTTDGNYEALANDVALLRRQLRDTQSRSDSAHREIARMASARGPQAINEEEERPGEEATTATADSTPKAPPSPVKYTAEIEKALFHQYFSELDEIREREGRDLAWAPAVEKRLLAATSKEAQILSAECSRTLCRTEIKHKDDDSRQKFLATLLMNVSSVLPQASYLVTDDLVTTAYLARAGSELPAMDTTPEMFE